MRATQEAGSRLAAGSSSCSSSSMPSPAKPSQPLASRCQARTPASGCLCTVSLSGSAPRGCSCSQDTMRQRKHGTPQNAQPTNCCLRPFPNLVNCRRQPSPPAAPAVVTTLLTGRAPASAAHSSGRSPAAAERGGRGRRGRGNHNNAGASMPQAAQSSQSGCLTTQGGGTKIRRRKMEMHAGGGQGQRMQPASSSSN